MKIKRLKYSERISLNFFLTWKICDVIYGRPRRQNVSSHVTKNGFVARARSDDEIQIPEFEFEKNSKLDDPELFNLIDSDLSLIKIKSKFVKWKFQIKLGGGKTSTAKTSEISAFFC